MERDESYLGDFSAAPQERSRVMDCPKGCGWWVGCADAADCPKCGAGVNWWDGTPAGEPPDA